MWPTNADIKYRNALVVGDACRGTSQSRCRWSKDIYAVSHATTLPTCYDCKDEMRFKMVTPQEGWSTIMRCWTQEPTSPRIVQDIRCFEDILVKVIKAEGCVVPDLCLRLGRRYRRADDSGFCESKPRASSRMSTTALPRCHPDCQEALNILHKLNTSFCYPICV